MSDPKTVKEVITRYMLLLGYKKLVCVGYECNCGIDNLIHCRDDFSRCEFRK